MLAILLVLSCDVFSQNSKNNFYLWRLHSVSGEASFNGTYREQNRTGINFSEYQKSSNVSGGLLLKTNSSVLHQNFLILDLEAAYVPETSKEHFVVNPDQSEVRTLKKFDAGVRFFKEKMINLSFFAAYNESFSSRENLTDIKSTNNNFGGILGINYKLLPVIFNFQKRSWTEEEIQSGRRYMMEQQLIGAKLNKDFGRQFRNEVRISHDENISINQDLFRISNTTTNIDFISHLDLDSKQKYSFNTMLSNLTQKGITDLKRLQFNESVNFILPNHFSLSGNYSYFNTHQDLITINQHNINSRLQHQLFKSLQSNINFDYNTMKHSVYTETNTKYGIVFNYTKIIPKGQLNISYKYERSQQNYNSSPLIININYEEYTLTDNKIVLLKLSNISMSSIIVKDATTTIIYKNGLDYFLIERGKYIEIKRIPGGLIAENTVVYIDYTATQPGTYKYNSNIHYFNSNIYFFNNILSFSYKFSTQHYFNLENTEVVTLNYFTQHIANAQLNFKFINAGIEYEDYKSSIIPYRMSRYYINLNKNFGNKILFMLNGNMQDYIMLDEPQSKYQRYMDANGRFIYSLFKQTQLTFDAMYRKQTGRGIDLDLVTFKTEVTSSINRLFISFGIELYRRNYIGEKINFKGSYIKIHRNF
ncbi:MAG: hypothetical protein ACOYO1_03795 [Bacteroidales bacterium]